MFVRAAALEVDEAQKRQLEAMARAGTTPQKTARKCQVILLASQGVSNYSIAQRTGLSRPTILAARGAFTERGIEGICKSKKRQRSPRALTAEVEQKILDNLEDQTGQRHPLERPRTGRQVGGVAHDGTARLAALRDPAPPGREVQDFQGPEV